jgi:hypothetical protein
MSMSHPKRVLSLPTLLFRMSALYNAIAINSPLALATIQSDKPVFGVRKPLDSNVRLAFMSDSATFLSY